MSAKLLVLVPPSEAKSAGGAYALRAGTFDEELDSARAVVVDSLRRLLANAPTNVLERIFNARGPLLARTLTSMTEVVQGHVRTTPAWKRYTGVVWSHLDAASLSPAQRRRLLVPSGLYGISTGMDPIADFRLKMDVGVAPLGTLATYWRPLLVPTLATHLKGAIVINLLPIQHCGAIDFGALAPYCTFINVDFVTASGSGAAGHDAKAVKGVLARRLVELGPSALAEFHWEGWTLQVRDNRLRVVAPPKS